MDLVQQIIERAKSNKQRIVLPEATEERTLRAADMVLADGVADIILIGNPDEINSLAEKWGLKISTKLLSLTLKTILRARSMQHCLQSFARRRA